MENPLFSRPLRAAARLLAVPESSLRKSFLTARVLIVLEPTFATNRDARETLVLAVNQVLRFCPNLAVSLPRDASHLFSRCRRIAQWIHGPGCTVDSAEVADARFFDAVINIGTSILVGLPSVTVNSTAWVARIASGDSGIDRLHWQQGPHNPIGALAAGSFGAGAAFLQIVGQPLTAAAETSLYHHRQGRPGSLELGPDLPDVPLDLNAFLVGCGAVSNGWAYAVKRLPIVGHLEAIDPQSVRPENIGPYIAVGLDAVGTPKATAIRNLLSPAIQVTDRLDRWEFFQIRLRHGLGVPPLIITGLDKVGPRHAVQRVWPETLIDMAADGLDSQVIVANESGDGLCLISALTIPRDEVDWPQEVADSHGLDPELVAKDPTGNITQAEADAASPEFRQPLQSAVGQPRCGHINVRSLKFESDNPDFAAAVPFVTAFSGIVGAAETMKCLMGHRRARSLHLQRSFQSGNSRALEMMCDPSCECQANRSGLSGAVLPEPPKDPQLDTGSSP